MVGLASHISLGGVLLAQFGHRQRGGGVVAQHHHGVFPFGLQHRRNPRHAGELAQLDGVQRHALFHHHGGCGYAVAGFPNLHHHRAALGGEPQVNACRLRGYVEHERLCERVEIAVVQPLAALAAVLRRGAPGACGAKHCATAARIGWGQVVLHPLLSAHALLGAQHGRALAHECLAAGTAQGAGEQHGFGARCDVLGDVEGARQLARGGALQSAARQGLAGYRDAVEGDGA